MRQTVFPARTGENALMQPIARRARHSMAVEEGCMMAVTSRAVCASVRVATDVATVHVVTETIQETNNAVEHK